jgi:meso-butanediol dehydrogenase/(S,S)-butanediol dehydrogenase/diacetyl reductase
VSLSGQRGVIVGGSGALGAAAARHFCARGASLLLVGRDTPRLARAEEGARAAAAPGAEVSWRRADITRAGEVEDAISGFAGDAGRLDFLLLLAGYERDFPRLAAARPAPEHIAAAERIIDVDLLGTLRALFVAEPILRRGGGGTIVTLGTTPTLDTRAEHLLYQTARAGVRQLVEVVAAQHRADGVEGVRVLWLALGNVFNPTTFEGLSPARRREADACGWLDAAAHVAPVLAWLVSGELPRPDGATIRLDARSAPALFAEAGEPFIPFTPPAIPLPG